MPIAAFAFGKTSAKESKVYINSTSMVEFFSNAFFFTISLTPFKTPYNKTNGIHNIFSVRFSVDFVYLCFSFSANAVILIRYADIVHR